MHARLLGSGPLLIIAALCAQACTGAIGGDGGGDGDGHAAPGQVCVPGEISCESKHVLQCNAAGSDWRITAECDSGCADGACVEACVPDCSGKVCGDDSCGGSCGACGVIQQACVAGACVCQPSCSGMDCGGDGCGGTCGACDPQQSFCSEAQTCQACETAVCGVCDEIDVSQIVHYEGIMGDHANPYLRAEVFEDWPITTDLDVAFDDGVPAWTLHHFDGESWRKTSNNYTDGAVMVACWESIAHGGIICQSWEWYTPDVGGIYRHFDWPAGKPVAHVLVSAIDEKRTAIKYFDSWPFTNPPATFDSANVSMNLERRDCH